MASHQLLDIEDGGPYLIPLIDPVHISLLTPFYTHDVQLYYHRIDLKEEDEERDDQGLSTEIEGSWALIGS